MVVAEISGGVPVLMDSVVMSSVFGKDTTGIIPVVELDELLPDDVASSMESVFTWDFMTTSLVLDVDVEVLPSEGVGLLDFSLATEPIDDVRDHNDDEDVCPRWDVATDSLSSGSVKELEKESLLMLEDLELVLSLGNDDDDDEEEDEEAVLVRPLDINDS